jgi:hypothetical protein
MAVNAEFNWLGQQRVDIPHLKMVESGVRYDFDALSTMLTGDASYIVRGFSLLGATVGAEASTISIQTAGSRLIHPLASESGSVFAVPSNRPIEYLNPQTSSRMRGAIQPNSTNFIGVDLRRSADSTTGDIVQFLSPTLGTESDQKVPLRRTLDYVFVIGQTDFSFNRSVAPVAIVVTDSANAIVSVKDARSLLGRLHPGGSYTSDVVVYGWPGGRPSDESTSTSAIAGDKALTDLKSWMNAVMTRLHELGGSQYWYSLSADRNVNLHTGATVFSGTGESFEIVGDHIHWQGLTFGFDNSPQYMLTIQDQLTNVPGLTDLLSGECIYVDLDRTTASSVAAQKGALTTLGGSLRPGARWVIVSRIGDNYYVNGQPNPIGTGTFNLATTVRTGITRISIDAAGTLDPIAVGVNTNLSNGYGVGTCTGISRNLDVGAAHTVVATGDLTIGRGTAAGDRNVLVRTEGEYGTTISGTGSNSAPYLSIRTGGGTPYTTTPPDSIPLDLGGLAQFEGTSCWNLTTVRVFPRIPGTGALGTNASNVKYFTKQSKTFRESVRLIMLGSVGTFVYNATNRTLTGTTNFRAAADGVNCDNDDRILVNFSGGLYNGPYIVTNQGGGGPSDYPVLTRSFDGGGPSSATVNNDGYDIFDGVSFKVTAGDSYSDTYWVLDAPHNAGACDLDGGAINSWNVTDNTTSDQLCVMFTDGSYTVITSGPNYSTRL